MVFIEPVTWQTCALIYNIFYISAEAEFKMSVFGNLVLHLSPGTHLVIWTEVLYQSDLTWVYWRVCAIPSWNMQNMYISLIEIFISKENLPGESIQGRENVFVRDTYSRCKQETGTLEDWLRVSASYQLTGCPWGFLGPLWVLIFILDKLRGLA